ncbi:GNAT family N-acetyltransferase [Streptomyces rectiverticillatus]|uniref:GNAT family N-acetyltransferase n=1 Tax=Streptomyces rectiverticillatus TaxID=173860 RepID=UPI001C4BA6CC|nr:GNAT family N-acetyltransferase [Streptomyces rectiverticillatus]
MRPENLRSAERASAVTFLEADRQSRRVGEPEAEPRSATDSEQWIDRMGHFLTEDPGGCRVAVDEGKSSIVGFAISQNRGRFWYLATYGVLPDRQGTGIGRRLMDAVLAHADGRRGMAPTTSTASPPPTSGRWTSAWQPASTSARRATWPCAA